MHRLLNVPVQCRTDAVSGSLQTPFGLPKLWTGICPVEPLHAGVLCAVLLGQYGDTAPTAFDRLHTHLVTLAFSRRGFSRAMLSVTP